MPVKFDTANDINKVRNAAAFGLKIAVGRVEEEARSLVLNTPKTGRIYKRRGVSHQASAPGEPFASDTGRTLAGIRNEVDRENLIGRVISDSVHAAKLEFGNEKIAARPYLRPALEMVRPEVDGIVIAEIERVLR